jgi:hypothetical protein
MTFIILDNPCPSTHNHNFTWTKDFLFLPNPTVFICKRFSSWGDFMAKRPQIIKYPATAGYFLHQTRTFRSHTLGTRDCVRALVSYERSEYEYMYEEHSDECMDDANKQYEYMYEEHSDECMDDAIHDGQPNRSTLVRRATSRVQRYEAQWSETTRST